MITRELAGKLRKAGFKSKEGAFIPTLEELIEICGDKIEIIGRTKNKEWFIQGTDSTGSGRTLEEAIANLFLELKK